MGRFPANSWHEWMVGQNYRSSLRRSPPSASKRVMSVDVSEAESGSDGEDVVQITTYPGRRRRNSVVSVVKKKKPSPEITSGRKRKPIKSALKKSSNSSSSTLVNTTEESNTSDIDTSDADTSEIDTSDVDTSDIDTSDIDTSEDDASARTKKKKSKKTMSGLCKKIPAAPLASDDALPHPSCKCQQCSQGRKVIRAVLKFEAQTKAAEEATAAETQAKSKGKSKQKGKKTAVVNDTDEDTSEVETSGDEIKPAVKGKNKKQQQRQKNSPKVTKPAQKPTPKVAHKSINKPSPRIETKVPGIPKDMRPNLLSNPTIEVLQIEEAMEGPYDPRPNAFYDAKRRTARVYQGPHWGNHDGSLYGDYPKEEPWPLNLPDAPPAHYHNGPRPPSGTTPWALARYYAAYPRPAGFHESWGPAPVDGNIPGFPPPTKPANYGQQPSWWHNGGKNEPEKSPSDKGSKKGSNASRASPPKDQAWGSRPDKGWGNASNKGSRQGNNAWVASPPKGQGWDSQPQPSWPDPPNNASHNSRKGKTPSPVIASAPKAPSPIAPIPTPVISPVPGVPEPAADPSQGPAGWEEKQDGQASPAKFGAWGDTNTGGFERKSKNSKENGNGNNGNTNNGNDWGTNQNQASGGNNQPWGNNSGGNKNQPWGDNSGGNNNQPWGDNSGGNNNQPWGNNNGGNNQKAWGDNSGGNNNQQSWGNNNGEQKPSPEVSKAPSTQTKPPTVAGGSPHPSHASKPPSADDAAPGNGGGNDWGNTNGGVAWGSNNGGGGNWGNSNGEQKPSSEAPKASSPHTKPPSVAGGSPARSHVSKAPSADHGAQGNGGGDAWPNNNDNNGGGNSWGNTNGDTAWNANDNKGTNGWNARPSSKPGSNAGSNQGNNWSNNQVNGDWANGGNGNGKGPGSSGSKPRSPLVPNPPTQNGDWNGGPNNNGKSRYPIPNNRYQGAFPWPDGSVSSGNEYHRSRRHSTCGGHLDSQHRGSSGRQPRVPRSPPGVRFDDFYCYMRTSRGPSDWTNKPSDQATGPSSVADWRNQDAAQDTHGAANRW